MGGSITLSRPNSVQAATSRASVTESRHADDIPSLHTVSVSSEITPKRASTAPTPQLISRGQSKHVKEADLPTGVNQRPEIKSNLSVNDETADFFSVGDDQGHRDDEIEATKYLRAVKAKYGVRSKSAKRLIRASAGLAATTASGFISPPSDRDPNEEFENDNMIDQRLSSTAEVNGIRKNKHSAQGRRTRERNEALRPGSRAGLEPLMMRHERGTAARPATTPSKSSALLKSSFSASLVLADESDRKEVSKEDVSDPIDEQVMIEASIADLARRSMKSAGTSRQSSSLIPPRPSTSISSFKSKYGEAMEILPSKTMLANPSSRAKVDRPSTSPVCLRKQQHHKHTSRGASRSDTTLQEGLVGTHVALSLNESQARMEELFRMQEDSRMKQAIARKEIWDSYKNNIGLSKPMQAAYAELYPKLYPSQVATEELTSLLNQNLRSELCEESGDGKGAAAAKQLLGAERGEGGLLHHSNAKEKPAACCTMRLNYLDSMHPMIVCQVIPFWKISRCVNKALKSVLLRYGNSKSLYKRIYIEMCSRFGRQSKTHAMTMSQLQ